MKGTQTMVQSTDTTATLPVVDPNPATPDSEQTVTIPVVTPLADSPQATVPATMSQPAFEADRARALHAHRVLQRILATPLLPLPSVWEGHAYSSPMLDLTLLDGGAEALAAYQRVFGGALATEQVAAHESPAGFPVPDQEYARLATVIEGVDVVVSCWTASPAAPAAEEPVDDPQRAYCCGDPEDHAHPAEVTDASVDTAPEPQPTETAVAS